MSATWKVRYPWPVELWVAGAVSRRARLFVQKVRQQVYLQCQGVSAVVDLMSKEFDAVRCMHTRYEKIKTETKKKSRYVAHVH